MVYSCVKEDPITLIKEEKQSYGSKKRKKHIQMDKILKRLFTLKNSKPIIDFLNSAYKDNISYKAKLYYADREINNFEKKYKMIHVYNNLKIVIKDTLKAIDLSYNNDKITLEDYDEMTSAIENINSYFLSMYGKYADIDEEVKDMVKSFYDPKVEERGVQKGIEKGKMEEKIETAAEMIKEGEPIEKIKKYIRLDENKVLELINKIRNEKVQ